MRLTVVSALAGIAFSGLAAAGETAGTVAVIRGTDSNTHESNEVVVIRQPGDSFMRETTRLAADADARAERAATGRAEDAHRRLAEALESLAIAAHAARPGFSDDDFHSHVWFTGFRPVPQSVDKPLTPVAMTRPSPP